MEEKEGQPVLLISSQYLVESTKKQYLKIQPHDYDELSIYFLHNVQYIAGYIT